MSLKAKLLHFLWLHPHVKFEFTRFSETTAPLRISLQTTRQQFNQFRLRSGNFQNRHRLYMTLLDVISVQVVPCVLIEQNPELLKQTQEFSQIQQLSPQS